MGSVLPCGAVARRFAAHVAVGLSKVGLSGGFKSQYPGLSGAGTQEAPASR